MTHGTHSVKVEAEVMQRVERSSQGFAGDEQMAQVGAAVAGANLASTLGVERSQVLGKAQVLDVESPFRSEQQAVTSCAGRQYAIHHVDTHGSVLHDLIGITHTHHI